MYTTDIEKIEEEQKICVAYKHELEREVKLLIHEKPDTKENRKRLKFLYKLKDKAFGSLLTKIS
jgi:hypothetical protein